MSDSGTMTAPARQKAVTPLRKEGRAGMSVDRKGASEFFISSSLQHEAEPGSEVRAMFVAASFSGPGARVNRRGKHESEDDLQRKCAECESEEKIHRKEEVELQRCEDCDEGPAEESIHRKEAAGVAEDVQRKCTECESGAEGAAAVVKGPLVHTKLTVGAPGDPFEVEADKMGEQVMRLPFSGLVTEAGTQAGGGDQGSGSGGAGSGGGSGASGVQRNEEEGSGEMQAKRVPGLQRTAQGGFQTSSGFSSRLRSSGGGAEMAAPVQQHMESAFGADFGAVRIHTGAEAASLSDEIGAQAFTYQNHVYFNDGKYDPGSTQGRFLLAHELTHTIQQGAAHTVRRDEGDVKPPPTEEESFLDKLKNGFDSVLSSLLPAKVYKVYTGVRDNGILNYVKSILLGLVQGLFSKLGFSDQQILLIFQTFIQIKDQLPTIITALQSGDCKPLFKALDLLGEIMGAIAGRMWDRLMDEIEPIRQWLLDIWNTYLSPALDEITAFAGEVWEEIKNFGAWIWQQFQPVIQKGKAIWAWVMGKLGFGDDPSQEGLMGWVSRKLGEAWTAAKKYLKPVIDPVIDIIGGIKSIVSLDAIKKFQEDAKKWLDEVAKTATAMGNQDDAVANKQLTLREVLLPALNKAIDRLKQTVRDAGAWVLDKVGYMQTSVNSMVTGIRSNQYVSGLYSVISWVPKTIDKMYDWASDKVSWIFGKIYDGVESLREFIDPILKGFEKLVDVIGDLVGKLPDFITGGIYSKIPACIKDPIIDWVTEKIFKNIPIISQFLDLKAKWPQIKAAALTVLKQVFVDGQLVRALWTFFRNLLSVLGIDPTLVTTIIAKAAKNFSDIIADPLKFFKNVWGVVKGGFNLFWDNIGTHLLQGALDWLFGEVKGAAGVALPQKPYTLGSVLGYVLQLFGISEDNVFTRMEKNPRIGQKLAGQLRAAWEAIKTAVRWIYIWIKEGPEGLLKEAKGKLNGLIDGVIDGVVSWVTTKISAKIMQKLATSVDPLGIGATINVLITVYDSINAAIIYANRILNITNQAMDNLAEIIAGNIGPASMAFRDLLVKALPTVIGFSVEVLLGSIGTAVKDIVSGGRKAVDGAIDWLIDSAVDVIEGVIGTVKKGVDKVKGWLGLTKDFTADNGETHTLSFKGSEQHATLMIASEHKVNYMLWIKESGAPESIKAPAAKKAKDLEIEMGKATNASYTAEKKEAKLQKLLVELGKLTAPIYKYSLPPSASPKYGAVGGHQWGVSMEVSGLTKVARAKGSSPTKLDAGTYAKLNQRRTGAGSYYVKGHLLNEQLGGLGKWENLTPITRSANGLHETSIESKIKEKVDAGNIVSYSVTPDYQRPSKTKQLQNAVDAAAKAGTLQEDPAVIKEIIAAEAQVPVSLVCAATMIDPKNNNKETDLVKKGTKIEVKLDQRPDDYDLVGEKKPEIYLDSGDVGLIQSIGKEVSNTLAARIVEAYQKHGGRFASGEDLKNFKVDGTLWFKEPEREALTSILKKNFVKLYRGK